MKNFPTTYNKMRVIAILVALPFLCMAHVIDFHLGNPAEEYELECCENMLNQECATKCREYDRGESDKEPTERERDRADSWSSDHTY